MMAQEWQQAGEYGDVVYETASGIAKITINRPEVRNAFRPKTIFELESAFGRARDDAPNAAMPPSSGKRFGCALRSSARCGGHSQFRCSLRRFAVWPALDRGHQQPDPARN